MQPQQNFDQPTLEQYVAKVAPNKIGELRPGLKNLDLKVIVVSKDRAKELKSGDTLTQCLIADATGTIKCNFYGEVGDSLRCGDIAYLMSAFTGVYGGRMVLYQSSKGGVYRLRDFFLSFNCQTVPNMSEQEWLREVDSKTGKDFFRKASANASGTAMSDMRNQ